MLVVLYIGASLAIALVSAGILYRWPPVDDSEVISAKEMAPDLFDPEP
jgi:hypothetical protein